MGTGVSCKGGIGLADADGLAAGLLRYRVLARALFHCLISVHLTATVTGALFVIVTDIWYGLTAGDFSRLGSGLADILFLANAVAAALDPIVVPVCAAVWLWHLRRAETRQWTRRAVALTALTAGIAGACIAWAAGLFLGAEILLHAARFVLVAIPVGMMAGRLPALWLYGRLAGKERPNHDNA